MRVTTLGSATMAMGSLQQTSQRLADLQSQLAGQRRITKPSDDPAGTVQALLLRSETARQATYDRATSDAQSRLTAADTAFGSAVQIAQHAQDLIRQGMNTGALDPTALSALADQIDATRSDLLRVANTTDATGRPIFGGTTAGSAAFDASGTYVGDANSTTRVVAAGTTVTVARPGDTAFGSGPTSVFAALAAASAAVRAGDTAGARAALTSLSTGLTGIEQAQTAVGVTGAQLQAIAATAAGTGVTRAASLSALQDVDVADMSVKLSAANLAYQVSLQSTATAGHVSLLDFLK